MTDTGTGGETRESPGDGTAPVLTGLVANALADLTDTSVEAARAYLHAEYGDQFDAIEAGFARTLRESVVSALEDVDGVDADRVAAAWPSVRAELAADGVAFPTETAAVDGVTAAVAAGTGYDLDRNPGLRRRIRVAVARAHGEAVREVAARIRETDAGRSAEGEDGAGPDRGAVAAAAESVEVELSALEDRIVRRWDSDLAGASHPGVDLTGTDLAGADLSDAPLAGARLDGCTLDGADLSRTDLQGASLVGAALRGAVVRDVQIDGDTRFLASGEYPWQTGLCVYDPRYDATGNPAADVDREDRAALLDRAANTYRTIEDLADAHALSELRTTCYVRRQDVARMGHRHEAATGEGAARVVAAGKWGFLWLSWAIMRYGESPWRVLYSTLAVIALWTVAFAVGDLTTASTWVENAYFSVVTFTTLGYGDYRPTTPLGQVLAGTESLVGGVLLALLVAVLGRRLMR